MENFITSSDLRRAFTGHSGNSMPPELTGIPDSLICIVLRDHCKIIVTAYTAWQHGNWMFKPAESEAHNDIIGWRFIELTEVEKARKLSDMAPDEPLSIYHIYINAEAHKQATALLEMMPTEEAFAASMEELAKDFSKTNYSSARASMAETKPSEPSRADQICASIADLRTRFGTPFARNVVQHIGDARKMMHIEARQYDLIEEFCKLAEQRGFKPDRVIWYFSDGGRRDPSDIVSDPYGLAIADSKRPLHAASKEELVEMTTEQLAKLSAAPSERIGAMLNDASITEVGQVPEGLSFVTERVELPGPLSVTADEVVALVDDGDGLRLTIETKINGVTERTEYSVRDEGTNSHAAMAADDTSFQFIAVDPLPWSAPGYERLEDVLRRAYGQAAYGKGKERHACDEPFHEQLMQTVGRLFGVGALLSQATKKAHESQRLPHERAVAELLGAINYLAGAVILLEDQEAKRAGQEEDA